jgi:tripartite-type tricarboxylate transporter receptor subunit TctC
MKLPRRTFLHLAVGAAALPAMPRFAKAQSYPSRPVRLIVTTPAGGSPDIIARLIGQWLSERLGQPIVVDNRSGASGNIGTEIVVRAPPDGYTLLMALSLNAINASLYDKLNFDFIRDTAPVASIASIPLVMEVSPSVQAKTVPEFIAYAKANRGKINMASAGNGSPAHVAGELFKMMAGVDMVHVPYRGEALALPDLISGQVQVLFGVMPASLGYIRAGKLRALAVTTAERQEPLPDVPTVGEFLPGFEARGWYGIVVPKAAPTEIVEKLNKEINAALADPIMKKRLTDLGAAVFAGSPADFGKFIADEIEKWRRRSRRNLSIRSAWSRLASAAASAQPTCGSSATKVACAWFPLRSFTTKAGGGRPSRCEKLSAAAPPISPSISTRSIQSMHQGRGRRSLAASRRLKPSV